MEFNLEKKFFLIAFFKIFIFLKILKKKIFYKFIDRMS